MKATIRFFVPLLAIVAVAPAGARAAQGVGVQAGVVTSGADVGAGTSADTLTGVSAGITSSARLAGEWLYVQPELNFVQRGADTTAFGARRNARLSYLELPVQAKVRVPIGGATPFLLAGPRLGYLLGTSEGLSRDQFNAFDVGADAGGGIGFSLGEGTELMVTAKYGWDFNDTVEGVDWRNQGLQVMAGLVF